MGLLPNSGILSYKYLNAKIKDAGGRIKFVQVRNYLGDYFVTTINNQPYVFKVDAKEVGIYDEFGVKKYRIIDYSTKHYKPISDKTNAIKELLEKHNLPRINMKFFNVLKTLGKHEKKGFIKHDIEEILDKLSSETNSKLVAILGRESKYKEASIDVVEFLESLETTEIVTPVKEIAEYIEDDLITTDPGFYGTVITTHQRTDLEHKKITNTPVGPKRPYAILLAIIFGLMLAGIGLYLLYENGTFDQVTGLIPEIKFDMPNSIATLDPNSIGAKYPTPESARAAIDRGDATLQQFPPSMRGIISSTPSPGT